ncbi:branched-chain amino acid ABC transporter permease [Variovorax sp. E3]|uniref:branched-chain amino acid ABC transporter permease n=1 Tax=Variovorax sp. E3 TaxID=1914993 RepID=UPI0018DCA0C9|nr:branched-chain amino acid ABC transporter permease [Variovorax sp. E3]
MTLNLFLDIVFLTLVWAGVAGSWNFLAGFAGQFSLGHAAFMGIGAYTSTLLFADLGLTPWVGLLAGAAFAAALAAVLAAVSLRTRGPFFTLMTIAFAEIVRILVVYFKGVTHGSEGVLLEQPPALASMIFANKVPYVLLAVVYAALVIGACVWTRRSRLGFFLLSVREDEDAARSLGVSAYATRIQATAISAAMAAIGGSLFAQYTLFIDPDSTLSFMLSVQPALIAIVGGLGNPFGPLLGALVVVPLEHLLRGWFGGGLAGLHGFIYGVAVILILLALPDGVAKLLPQRRPTRT